MQDIIKELEKRYQDEWEELKAHKPNLMIVGGSGVGKSSLINKVFGQELAKVGTGKPVTESICLHTSPRSPINIFDTMGYEPGDSAKFDTVLQYIEDRKTKPLQEQIHIIWYCLPIPNGRIFPYDAKTISSLKDSGTPLFIVFTKCDKDDVDEEGKRETAQAFKKILAEEYGLGDVRCFETAGKKGTDDFDLNELLKESCSSLSEEIFRKAFALAQIHNIELKSSTAHGIIHSASVAAGAAAATPIPCADAPVITGIQVAMCTALANLYGVASAMGEASMSLLKAQILSMLGKQLVRSLVKFIPILGSAINASVAVAFTEALGWGMVALYEKVLEEYLRTGKEPAWVEILSSDILINFVKEKMAS